MPALVGNPEDRFSHNEAHLSKSCRWDCEKKIGRSYFIVSGFVFVLNPDVKITMALENERLNVMFSTLQNFLKVYP